MARSRNIKPGFFVNDKLAECDPLARLLFAGLWCIADREGRLEDRPKRIRVEVLPYDDCDIEELLGQLAQRGFIVRYEVNGVRYIEVTNFLKHQNPHKNEKASEIPPPTTPGAIIYSYDASPVQAQEQHGATPVQAPEQYSTSMVQVPEHSGTSMVQVLDRHQTATILGTELREGKNPANHDDDGITAISGTTREISRQVPEKHSTTRDDSLNMIPDSFKQTTDYSTRSSDATGTDDVAAASEETGVNQSVSSPHPSGELDLVLDAWREHIGELGPTQLDALTSWIEEPDRAMPADVVVRAIEIAAQSGVRRLSYVEGILRNWLNDGIRTLEDIERAERRKHRSREAPVETRPRFDREAYERMLMEEGLLT